MVPTSKDLISITAVPRGWPVAKLLDGFTKSMRRLKLVDGRPIALSVSFVGAPAMKRLNSKHRRINKVTDVLSFEVDQKHTGPVQYLGDLVICTPVVRSQAKEVGHRVVDELAVLLCHGLLHLVGFDHERSTRHSKEMAKVEAKLLRGLGVKGLIKRVEQ